MTRKDYVMLAEALRSTLDPLDDAFHREQHEADATAVADALARDNPRFDRERFLKAAGVTG